MSDIIYGYHDKLWIPDQTFTYTGTPQEFTLPPGEYLIMCHGASGGGFNIDSHWTYGAVAYGVLNLTNTHTLYAYVGGDGETSTNGSTVGHGGFNGGGDGGLQYGNNSQLCGHGGGGASDVRTSTSTTLIYTNGEPILPTGYTELDYIEAVTPGPYIDTGYVHKTTTKVEWIGIAKPVLQSGLYQILFGSRIDYHDDQFYFQITSQTDTGIIYATGNTETDPTTEFPFDGSTKVRICTDGPTCTWYTGSNLDIENGSVTNSSPMCDGTTHLILFGMSEQNSNTSPSYLAATGCLYSFKIWEDEELMHHFQPCYRKSDNVIGLYDLIDNTFKPVTGTFNMGNVVSHEGVEEGLYSRIIVAAGSGGANNTSATTLAYGGGVVSNYLNNVNDPTTYRKYASQTNGFSFGKGQTALDKSVNVQPGASGGGGGWFGGYAFQSNVASTPYFGTGGSSYVLTSSSYKPDGYLVNDPELFMTDMFVQGAVSEGAKIVICKPVSFFNAGDTLRFVESGVTSEIRLPIGSYRIKCYGGEGGFRRVTAGRILGGYSEGVLSLTGPRTIFVNVAGTGLRTTELNNTYSEMSNVTSGFNGGGNSSIKLTNNSPYGCGGGGASDVRLDTNDLLARIIVAGGGGGDAANSGGKGGGTTGATPAGSYGTNNGPGTQNSPVWDNTLTGGGFGFGGNSAVGGGSAGGAGGGGWFGGCGTTPDGSSDDDKGGAGGSGYVLTESSFKPDGYLIDDVVLTDTSTVQGGNTLPIGVTRVDIVVEECSFVSIIIHDSDGYKGFNSETNVWEFVSTELEPDIFINHGTSIIKNLDGINDEFDVIVQDLSESITSCEIGYIPKNEKISTVITTDMFIARTYVDADYDPAVYNMTVDVKKLIDQTNKIKVDVSINKLQVSDKKLSLFAIQLYNK